MFKFSFADVDVRAWDGQLKNKRRGRLSEYAQQFPEATYTEASKGSVWNVEGAQVASPLRTREHRCGPDVGAAAPRSLSPAPRRTSSAASTLRCWYATPLDEHDALLGVGGSERWFGGGR
eukprot:2453045-Rhodomonas_salina.3